MNDYKTALKEYQEVQNIIKNQINDMVFLSEKVNLFKSGMLSIEDSIKFTLDNDSSEKFNFLNPLFNNFIQEIHKTLLSYNEQIIIPLKNFIQNFQFATNNSLNSFNQIKVSLIESKQKVTKAKDEYYNFIKSNKNNSNAKDDNNELLKAKIENYSQLYKYEVNKMNEIIAQNNKNYDDIAKNLSSINISVNSIIKNILSKFSKNLLNFGNIFNKFSEQINESLNTEIKNIENNNTYPSYIDEKTKLRFKYEIFEEFEEFEENKKNESNKDKNEIIGNDENNEKDKNNNNKSLKRLMSLPRKGFDDFEIVDTIEKDMDQEKMKENLKILKDIVKQLISEKEITPLEIKELINILKEKSFQNNQTFSYIFLKNIKQFYQNRVINLKNRQNFIHLANIMNNICIQEGNTKTFNEIIEVSQMIKYENLFIYSMIQKKNHFFSTKTFWLKLIEENLIDKINNYVDKLLEKKAKDDHKVKGKEKDIKSNNDQKDYILNIDLSQKIINYKKLSKQQKKDVDIFAYKNICIILSKTIQGMCSFLVPEFISIDIINYFSEQFNFDEPTKKYFRNLLSAKNIKNTLSLKENTEESKRKNDIYNITFIISCTLKYLPKNEFRNLIPLNKDLKPLIEKKIFKFVLSNRDLAIEKRIELLGIILKVKDIDLSYQDVKNLLKERLDDKMIIEKSQEERNLNTIKVDLFRTPYINNKKDDIEKLGWVLKCLNFAKPDIGYLQGMNFLALFFYQLLGYDEEKTFNYMLAFEMNTKYAELFKDDIKLLKIYFIILDKIINLYKPELYYKFVDSYISTNIYSTTWFVTFFTNGNCVFEKKDAPKYLLMVLEDFILDGWSAIFNSGFTLMNYNFDKIMMYEGDKLITFMINDLCELDSIKNENFNIIKKLYEKNSVKINEVLIKKLLAIAKYENNHDYLSKY